MRHFVTAYCKLSSPRQLGRVITSFAFMLLFSLQLMAQDRRVTGTVTGEGNQPLSNVSVVVKGTTAGTVTNEQGVYSITVPAGSTILVFSYVGYGSREEVIGARTTIDVSLVSSASNSLGEVVVIGYGTAAKRDLTGSIVKIAGREVADKPNTNPVASLQGKVAGLSVVNSGTPGQEPDIRIRGTNSIGAGATKPLYLVDGVFNDNIDYLNPNDIESIEILKDPSSLAIFGIRGTNGVIAITTKRARSGQVMVNVNSTIGAKRLVDKIKMANAEEFKMLFQEEEINIGVPVNERFNFSKWTGNTNWVDEMTRTGLFSINNVSLSGGSDKNKFYMGVGYTKEQGIVRHEELDKITLSFNDELRLSKGIKIGFNFNGLRQKLPFSQAQGLLYDARRVLPITPVFNSDEGVYTELAIQAAQISNPVMNLESKWNKELRYENRMVGNVYADITILKNLNLRSTVYADRSDVDERRYNPIINTYNPALDTVYVDRNNRTTSVNQNSLRWNKFQQDHILTYKNSFNNHNLTLTGGFTTYYSDFRGLYASVRQKSAGDIIPDDKRFWYIDNGFGDASTRRSASGQWEKTTVSGLFRALYNFQNKYFLNASFRRDASSQISPDNRSKNFYSVGAAWELTREDFMRDQKTFNFVKIKASWGILGNQNTYGYDYPFYPALESSSTAVFGDVIAPAYSVAYTPNRNLTWESSNAKEVGVEMNVLDNRLHFEAAYYHKRTKDVMTLINDGTGRLRLDNVGELINKGIEALASWNQRLAKDLTLTLSANITTLDNEVVALGGDRIAASEERPNQTEAGYPIGYFYGYIVEGVYQSYAEKLASPKVIGYDYGPGDLKYKDINNDGIIDTKDRTMIGNPTPDFMYGASVNLAYKNFDISADFNGVYGNEVYRFWGSSELPFTTFNYPAFKVNRWHGAGTSNWDPILGANHTINRLPSTYGIEDGSYFRIRNLQVGYTVRPKMFNGLVKNFRVFLNAQNLKTFKNNSGYTPEFGGLPTAFGIDNGNGPVPAVYTGGINITF